ncbi:MAG: hypothetical protein AAF590_08105 [Pseudomonadota bacterium]
MASSKPLSNLHGEIGQTADKVEALMLRLCRQTSDFVLARITLAVVVILGLTLVIAFAHPIDLQHFINGDSLYPIQMTHFSLLDYRPPPPNRIVPDVAVHWLISPLVADPLLAKLIAGSLLFVMTLAAVAVFKPVLVFLLAAALFAWPGFTGLNSATHFTLPLVILLVQLATKNAQLDAAAFTVAAFSNILAALPLALLLFDGRHPDRTIGRAAAIMLGIGLAALYSDFGEAFFELAVALPMWVAAFAVARKMGISMAFALSVAVLLLVATMLDLLPARYTIPVSVAMLIVLTPVARPSFNWMRLLMPFAMVGTMLSTANADVARQIQEDFNTLLEELDQRDIRVIATDHWTAKPLYFAALANDFNLTLTQTNFATNTSHPWMAPYIFAGLPTRWALRSSHSCDGPAHGQAIYCAQDSAGDVLGRTDLPGGFTLFEYREPVPHVHWPAPASKSQAIRRQLQDYAHKAFARLGFMNVATWLQSAQASP